MAAAGGGNFISGLLQGFAQTRERQKERDQEDKEKKAKVQLFEIQLEREKRANAELDAKQQAQQQFFQHFQNLSTGSTPLSASRTPIEDPRGPMSLVDMLAEPRMQELAMKSGFAGMGDFMPKQVEEPTNIRELRALAADPALAAADLARRRAGASSINLGEAGLNKPPPGYARPNPTQPGLVREPGAPPTPGQESLDKAFGTDAAAWVGAGGFADTQKSIAQLGEAKAALDAVASGKSKDKLTGPVVSRVPNFAKQVFNPKAVAVRDSVEEIVQRNLRLVLGSQFTEKEGERLIARAYNENLDEAENSKRVGRLMTQLQSAAKAKQEAIDYFNQHGGTLEGFTGKIWTAADFDPDAASSQSTDTSDPLGIR